MTSQPGTSDHDPPHRVCPDCGVSPIDSVTRCWLCGKVFDQPILAEVAFLSPQRKPTSYTLASLLVLMTLIAVFFGLVSVAPGLAILYLLIVVPAMIGSLYKSRQLSFAGRRATIGERVGAALLSVAVVWGILGLLFVAAFAALFAICFYAVSQY